MKKHFLKKLCIILWLSVLICLGGYYLFFAPRDSAFSETENRTLAGFPAATGDSVFSGDFGEAIETYLLDRFPGRDRVIMAVNRLESLFSFASHEEYLLIAEDVEDPLDSEEYTVDLEELLASLEQNTEPTTQPAETEATEVTEAPEPTELEITEPVEDPPIVAKPMVNLEDYPEVLGMYMDRGTGESAQKTYSRSSVAAVTAVLNKYAELLPENGKLMFTVGPPSYVVQRFVNAEEKVSFHNTWDELITDLGRDNVYAFDSSEILSEAIKVGEYVSFRNDNHWTPYGAYLVYRQMAARAGKELVSYTEDFDITVEEPFRGTYYRDDPAAYMYVPADTLERLMPKIPVEYRQITGKDEYKVIDFLEMDAAQNDRYTVYLGGPGGPWRYVECDNEQTENCLVVTDSFGLTVIPFLTGNYKQIHYYDARYYNYDTVGYTVAEMIEKYNIHDIYVIVADFHSFDSGFLLNTANYHLNCE